MKSFFPRAKEKIRPFIDSYISSTVSAFHTVRFTEKQIDTIAKQVKYALLPVWMVYYDFDKTEYTFAMNGQTGKVVGRPPISKGKVALWFSGVSAASFLVLKIVSWVMGGGFL